MAVKYYDGSSFVEVPAAEYYDGSSWQEATVSYWDGSQWVQIFPSGGGGGTIRNQWPLDDGSGSTDEDSAGSADMTLNGVSWVNDTNYVGDYAGSGDGSNDYGDVGTLGDFGSSVIPNDFAIAFTVKTTDPTGFFFGKFRGSGHTDMQCDLGDAASDGVLSFLIQDDNENNIRVNSDGARFDDGSLHRIGIAKRGSSASDMQLYDNGSPISTAVGLSDSPSTWSDFNNPLYFWARNLDSGGDGYLDGEMDNIKIVEGTWEDSDFQDDYDSQPWS